MQTLRSLFGREHQSQATFRQSRFPPGVGSTAARSSCRTCSAAGSKALTTAKAIGALQTSPSTPHTILPLISAPPSVIPPVPGFPTQQHAAVGTDRPCPCATRTARRAGPGRPAAPEGRDGAKRGGWCLAVAHSAAPPGGRRAPLQLCRRRPRRQDGRPVRHHELGGDMASGARRGTCRLRDAGTALHTARQLLDGFLYRRHLPGEEHREPRGVRPRECTQRHPRQRAVRPAVLLQRCSTGTACAFLREAAEMRILQCPHWV